MECLSFQSAPSERLAAGMGIGYQRRVFGYIPALAGIVGVKPVLGHLYRYRHGGGIAAGRVVPARERERVGSRRQLDAAFGGYVRHRLPVAGVAHSCELGFNLPAYPRPPRCRPFPTASIRRRGCRNSPHIRPIAFAGVAARIRQRAAGEPCEQRICPEWLSTMLPCELGDGAARQYGFGMRVSGRVVVKVDRRNRMLGGRGAVGDMHGDGVRDVGYNPNADAADAARRGLGIRICSGLERRI